MRVVDIHQGRANAQRSVQASIPVGESPPPPPWACFGRDKLIENIAGLADNLESFALIGAGGIGKTSIALAVLHHDRIKGRFGENRRFIRCDQFPPSRIHLLARLSKVIGAGVDNPEDLAPLRPFLASRDMILFLDNAELILDPQGPEAREMYAVVEELSRFSNICLGITSRVSTVPPCCKRPIIHTLSTKSACEIFYGIHDTGERSDIVSDLVGRLDFHALSITLLATAASHNVWSYERLAKEWDTQRARVLRTDYNESLAAAIELSLASPTFRKLGADARELLGVVAFYPQGIDENNLDWLFPTIPDRNTIFDKFCLLSLTSRRNEVITMLAPIRDYLGPREPSSSPLLCATKDHYFSRLSTYIYPDDPGFRKGEWIRSEDVNVEHLLNVFISTGSDDVWTACANFLKHLYWYKSRPVSLAPAIEGLPDDHRLKPECLYHLSRSFQSIGNRVENKRLLIHVLELWRKEGDDANLARTLKQLSDANRRLNLLEEGIQQSKEASEIFKRLGNTGQQAECLINLAHLLLDGDEYDAAEEAVTTAIESLPEKGEEFLVCKAHRTLGDIFYSKGEKGNAIRQFEIALKIASTFNFHNELFWIHHSLASLFLDQDEFNNAQVHIEQAKSHATEDKYLLGRVMEIQARIWFRQHRLEDATSEVLRAIEIFQTLGAADDIARCEMLLWENWMQRWNSGSDFPRSKPHQLDRSSSVVSSDDEYGPSAGDSIVSRLSEKMVQGVFSDDPTLQLDATMKFRRLISIKKQTWTEWVVERGVVPRFVQFLRVDHAMLQYEAAWVLTNIASGTTHHTQVVINANAIPEFVRLLSSPVLDVRNQAVWALGNIAGDSPLCRNSVLQQGALRPLLTLLNENCGLSMQRKATWALSNFCGKERPPPDWELVSPALEVLKELIYSTDDKILNHACRAISYLSDGSKDRIQAVIELGVCQRLVDLLMHPSASVKTQAICSVGNIVTGDELQTQVVIASGALPALLSLLSSPNEGIRKEVCWTISNITAGSPPQIQAVIDANIIPPLINILSNADFKTRKEACWAISNATSGGLQEPTQIRYLVNQGCIKPLCDLLTMMDNKIIQVPLDGLDNILKVGEMDKAAAGAGAANQYAIYVEEAGGMIKIHNLQSHDDGDIHRKAYYIMDKYFPNNREVDAEAGPANLDASGSLFST
ncbi:armadillo-type protein [Thelephora terrestris]|uniref:Protein unc-45 homolog B n=1 Tax=Thelephora terrestris TaxID=56493 RepID=A0A9P6HHA8_9AGAM|nr:armadillo-type protein [Thelephora terrestris]